MNRPSWDEYFMELLPCIATRSTCLRHSFGAIVARNNHVLATGYNGAVSSATHCTDKNSCWRNTLRIESGTRHEICSAVHAEQNAIAQAAKLGISLEGGTIYISDIPCTICAKLIINAGIKRVVLAGNSYPDTNGLKIISSVGIPVLLHPGTAKERIFTVCSRCGVGHFICAYDPILCPSCMEAAK